MNRKPIHSLTRSNIIFLLKRIYKRLENKLTPEDRKLLKEEIDSIIERIKNMKNVW